MPTPQRCGRHSATRPGASTCGRVCTWTPRAGGQLTEAWTDHDGSPKTTRGEIVEVRPGALIALRWADEGWPAATDVEVTLRPVPPSKTLVTVRESGWNRLPEGERLAVEHQQGWEMHLDHLREHVGALADAAPAADDGSGV